jgi:hypothetical protein
LPKLEKTENFQIEGSRNLQMNKNNLKNLHAQKVFWKKIAKLHCVGHFTGLMIKKKM